MDTESESRKRTRNTGELALIFAAERLFAQHGIAGVSLRQINQAANHRNISAAHYHFGSREGLIEAVLEYRVLDLDERRKAFLKQRENKSDLRTFVEALVVTLADELKPRPEGNHYLQFVQQYERYKGAQAPARGLSPAGVDIYKRIERCISYLPPPVRKLRVRYLVNMMHGVLATVERELGTGTVAYDEIPLITSDLIDMIASALTAPLSGGTMDILESRVHGRD